MPDLTLNDGRVVSVRATSRIQLTADFPFGASRERPVLIDVVAVDGEAIPNRRLVVMDSHCIWRSHQVDVAPRTNGRPAVVTGLAAAEVVGAQEFFDLLATGATSPQASGPDSSEAVPASSWWGRFAAWLGKHLGPVVSSVVAAVVTALVLAWLGLKR
jgi:hypothetical protein